jgi:hypothetical protein
MLLKHKSFFSGIKCRKIANEIFFRLKEFLPELEMYVGLDHVNNGWNKRD